MEIIEIDVKSLSEDLTNCKTIEIITKKDVAEFIRRLREKVYFTFAPMCSYDKENEQILTAMNNIIDKLAGEKFK